MSDIAIRVQELGKLYRIGTAAARHDTLRDALASLVRPSRSFSGQDNKASNGSHFWALKDISFEIKRGTVIGVIGRNGAGKSTLLKILSRITEPTTGFAEIHGRVGSLLEVGTGFHPELTGRENIYLNGAILGMKRVEIDRKFDEIVAFSEIERFLDTPVKRYSSGMYVRLAFAVAAHLEPEILLVDEVLAVGDAAFQKKCMGKMGDVAGHGRTVLFVSHNMGVISQMCPQSIALREGRIVDFGDTREVINRYLKTLQDGNRAYAIEDRFARYPDRDIVLTGSSLLDQDQEPTDLVIAGQPITMEFEYRTRNNPQYAEISLTIFNQLGIPVSHLNTAMLAGPLGPLGERGHFRCTLEDTPLPSGSYRVALAVHLHGRRVEEHESALEFDVDDSGFFAHQSHAALQYSTMLLRHAWLHGKA